MVLEDRKDGSSLPGRSGSFSKSSPSELDVVDPYKRISSPGSILDAEKVEKKPGGWRAVSFILDDGTVTYYDPAIKSSVLSKLHRSNQFSYLSSFLVTVVHKFSGGHDRPDWLNKNLNAGKLDYFYYLIAVLGVVNLVYFWYCARGYRYKVGLPIEDFEEDKSSDDVEMTSKKSME
ncbi:unnamed protein product [Arabidopsis thaliana]|uniref:(thale cress) hypothetical protein n=1 Tax=Arabidopsis thaliana TaxID=3702 RepID=A0A7G2E3W2_ARATH|nr:unnamed protein product [Arabidopsis thaliana]